mmetsp:Transcript_40618/g.61371  ORF Transcript_40618/g.61371 Transcript_40618/m.61371 type:complete len:449 (+) Transcript_40618:221-1567(+)
MMDDGSGLVSRGWGERLKMLLALTVSESHEASDTILFGFPLDPDGLAILHRTLQQLESLSDLDLSQDSGPLSSSCIMHRSGSCALVVRGPGFHGRLVLGDPAQGAIAEGLDLQPCLGLEVLLLGALQHLHRFSLGQDSDLLSSGQSREPLCEGHVLQDAEVLVASFSIDSACIALDGDPTNSFVLEALALDTGDPSIFHLHGSLLHHEEFASSELSNDLAVLDVEIVCHRDRGCARVVLVVGLGENGAGLVPNAEPANGTIGDGLALHLQSRLEGGLARTFNELQDLLGLECPHDIVTALALDLLLKRGLDLAGVEGLLDLLQEWRSLISLQGDPASDAVHQRSTPDSGDADLRICLRSLQELNDLVDLSLSQGLGLRRGDVQTIRDGNALHNLEVLLHECLEGAATPSTGLHVSAEELHLLRHRSIATGEVCHKFAEGLFGDLVAAP